MLSHEMQVILQSVAISEMVELILTIDIKLTDATKNQRYYSRASKPPSSADANSEAGYDKEDRSYGVKNDG